MVTETPDVPGDRQVAGASSTQTAETPQALRNWWAGFLKRSKKDHNTGTITFITSFCHSIMPSLFLIFLLYIFFFLATVEIFTLCLKLILPSAHASMILSVVDEMPILPPHEFIVEYIVDMMAFCMIALLPELLFTPVLTFIADTLSVANRLATIRSASEPLGIFGVPLHVSIKYANVAISLVNDDGESFIYGYVPIVVAKCGVFLKEKATDVEGIFRLSGSAKRIKELQAMFNSPDRYGKGLDWAGYTVHDASNVLRRYLNQLPEPIVPLAFYNTFRDPLRTRQGQAVGDMEAQSQEPGDVDLDKTIGIFQRLITELPPLNRQLLLYILDLLAVFASKSDVNLMNSANLAAIFQPGVLSHPTHDMNPPEYRLSQDVLIFLIDNQDSFLIGMSGTAADKSTIQEVQSGPQPPRQSYTPQKLAQVALGRSASNASAGTESVRKYGDIRRNLSVSSKNSKKSTSPGTPSSGAFAIVTTGSGVYRSNTVPSKKSPGLSSGKFSRGLDSPNTPIALSPALLSPGARSSSPGSKAATMASESRDLSHSASTTPTVEHQPIGTGLMPAANAPHQSKERLLPGNDQQSVLNTESSAQIDATPPPKVRKVSGLLTKTPTNDGKEPRQPNKLKKKRIPSSAHPSANSSTHSLPTAGDSPSTAAFFTPLVTPGIGQTAQTDPLASLPPIFSNTAATPQSEKGPILGDTPFEPKRPTELEPTQQPSDSTLKPKSPAASVNSKSSINDLSEHDHNDEAKKEKHEKRGLFRFSMPGKKNGHATSTVPSSDKRVGSNVVAEASSSSIGSVHVDRKSMSNDIPRTSIDAVPPVPRSALGFEDKAQEEKDDSQKKGLFNRLKTKVAQAREDRKERDIEKERAKSPPREEERSGSKHSLSAIALPSRGRSLDVNVEQQGPPLILETEAAPVPSGQSTHL